MKDLKVTIIQSNLHWENVQKNLDMFAKKISHIQNVDLIVLPEMFTTGFTMKSAEFAEELTGKTVEWMKAQSKKTNAVICGGIITKQEDKFYNTLIWMCPDGTFEHYNKRHLFRMGDENKNYSAGDKRIIVDLKGWKLCPMVCYDLRFPVWSRNRSRVTSLPAGQAGSGLGDYKTRNQKPETLSSEYDLLIYIANWPEKRNHPWKTLLQARAIENLSYVVGVNRVGNDNNNNHHSGDSAVINYKGEIISKIKPENESAETVSISYSELIEFRKTFPAAMDADGFNITI